MLLELTIILIMQIHNSIPSATKEYIHTVQYCIGEQAQMTSNFPFNYIAL